MVRRPELGIDAALPARIGREVIDAAMGSYPLDQTGHRVIPDSSPNRRG
jgi:hypothetical protein